MRRAAARRPFLFVRTGVRQFKTNPRRAPGLSAACRSEFQHCCGIGQTMQTVGGGLGKAQQQRPPAGWGHALQFGLPHDFRAIGVGHEETRLLGYQIGRRLLRDGEIEPVATGGLVAPLSVGAKIRRA